MDHPPKGGLQIKCLIATCFSELSLQARRLFVLFLRYIHRDSRLKYLGNDGSLLSVRLEGIFITRHLEVF